MKVGNKNLIVIMKMRVVDMLLLELPDLTVVENDQLTVEFQISNFFLSNGMLHAIFRT